MQTIEVVLLKCAGPAPEGLHASLTKLASENGVSGVHANETFEGGELYIYIELNQPQPVQSDVAQRIAIPAQALLPGRALTAARLVRAFDMPGASSGEPAPFHYTVENDPAPGSEEEMMRWYDTEHMPGLAAVIGTVRAQRFFNLDSGPRSLASYDLVSPNTLGSAPWLAVRHTEWSSLVRPNFRNTKRTMFHHLAPLSLL